MTYHKHRIIHHIAEECKVFKVETS